MLILFQTDFDKRQFAIKSHEFNLKDKVYCDLFPDLVVASKNIVEDRKVSQASPISHFIDYSPLAI